MKPQLLLPAQRVWRRELPNAGTVLVRPGDNVLPGTPVAEGQVLAPPVVVALGQAQASAWAGQEVQAGEVIARRKKLIGNGEEVRAPVAGKVLLVEIGELLLQPPPLTLTLEAQLPGTVAAVRGGWGVDLESCLGLLRGCGGVGPSQYGTLGQELAVETEPLTTSKLQALASQGVQAVIAPSWGEPPQPSPVTDGPAIFLTERGRDRAMSPPVAAVLKRHLGQAAALQLGAQPLLGFASNTADDDQQCFGPGAWVRSADGRAGRLLSIADSARFFASGLQAVPAEVDLGDRTEVLAFDSLEWIA